MVTIIKFYLSVYSLPIKKNISSDLYFPEHILRQSTCPQLAYWWGRWGKQMNRQLQYNVISTLLLGIGWDDGNKYKVLMEH